WNATRTGAPQSEFYATVFGPGLGDNFPVIVDTNGVPVWWSEPRATILLAPLPNGNLATFGYLGSMVERNLDGTETARVFTDGAISDPHDVLLLPNGNYVLATLDARPCDLTDWGASATANCLYHTFQELEPDGDVVWSWGAEEDIPITETSDKWRRVRDLSGRADPWHYNSVEWTGDGFIISFRHLDAVYKVDYDTKDVVWKLGGSTRPESLEVLDDPVFDAGGSISGQHDARLLSGGVVSLFDNGSQVGRAPRSVAYDIDEGAMTATLVSDVTDPIAPTSFCCGSTRRVEGGNWVTAWGGTKWFSENEPDGDQVFRLAAGFFYRVVPLTSSWHTRDELRAGMDAQFDDGVAVAPATANAAAAPPVDMANVLGIPTGD
ncbi:MAG: aryl-sulfate sulfotransferase, partial [Ilumatobacteraceae bacterium]